jgi:hypothetical protein
VVARPVCVDCGGALVDLGGAPLPSWDREHPRCVRCNNHHVARTQLIPSLLEMIASGEVRRSEMAAGAAGVLSEYRDTQAAAIDHARTTGDIPVNPNLPRNFENTPNERRPASHQRWWGRPFIVSLSWEQRNRTSADRDKWFEAWPGGTRYDVRCLDGGAWDRSTWWGAFATLEEAIECAKSGPSWRRSVRERR